MSLDRHILKTSLPSAHAASASLTRSKPVTTRGGGAPPNAGMSQQEKGSLSNRPGTDPRHMAIALHHARQIQAQKDAEALILDRILDLVQFPASSSADPSSPSPEDARAFKSALIPFQPADYDNLILERNIEGLCGYTLCPHEHRKEDSRGAFRITWGSKGSGPGGRGREMNIVPREKLEMWCSDACAERAMFIRVQLAEQPVWERRAGDTRGTHILLLEEERARSQQQGKGKGKKRSTTTVNEVAGQLGDLHVHEGQSPSDVFDHMANLSVRDDARSQELALERGDVHPALYTGRVDINVQENSHTAGPVTAPQMRPGDEKGGSIEGYVPRDH
ncbi:Rtr1/RPAP2 family protein phosphatase [Aspergillus homomorphus CBS 101889]|uniref:RNA polymerase II subunit B1 CTD phosphatase RPAP2 homolog n=1 Tax=Aspergillus homomorphus (strain CBS 101889) TaxID=1450537 RepID=A0A395HZF5_ASPHC|nr:hypothetical protein BO97DRAFT_406024 [Aspergillus homomorphus CBS 101889]RAL11644.1 hypothetical protein BO97DRAFT_406024 [Aspergillus homomorphus CBS 101889]